MSEYDDEITLTAPERRVVRALERLVEQWPDTLFLFANAGYLELRKCSDAGQWPSTVVAYIDIPADGGDPGAEPTP